MPFLGLPEADPGLGVDLRLHIRPAPAPVDGHSELVFEHERRGRLALSVFRSELGVRFRYRHAEFVVDPSLQEITCFRGTACGDDLVGHLFLNLVAAFVLNERGRYCLHASSVRVGDEAIAFLAHAGGGKSSLAASLVAVGLPLLTEDVLALERRGGRVWALPGPAQLRLWPDAVRELWGDDPGLLPRHALRTDKRQIWLEDRLHCSEALPLRTLYVLERGDDGAVGGEPLSASAGLLALVGSVFGNFLSTADVLTRQLEFFGEAMPVLEIRRLRVPATLAELSRVREALLAERLGVGTSDDA